MNNILTHFGFTKMPFVKNIAATEIFKSESIDGLLGMFNFGISTEDIMLAFGEIGCGKTVALRLFINSLDKNKYHPLYIKTGRMNASHLYNAICSGIKIKSPSRYAAARNVYEKAISSFREKIILIMDDAQDMHDDALLEIRNLVNFEVDSQNRICIILSGQPELEEKLRYKPFAPVKQRIRLTFNAMSMNLEETCRFINHQLELVQSKPNVFTDDAKSEIFKRSNGLPA